MADCMVDNNAQAATVFPVLSGYDLENVLRGVVFQVNIVPSSDANRQLISNFLSLLLVY